MNNRDLMQWARKNKETLRELLATLDKKALRCPDAVKKRIAKEQGIKLDIGCGDRKQEGFVGMDYRKTKNVDIGHNAESMPYPLPDNSCKVVLLSHVVEHLKPWLMVDLMNEWWRITKPGGQLWLAMPYATSPGFWQDPTHIKTWNENTALYFDPSCELYSIYKPKPWKITRPPTWYENGNLEIVFEKRMLDHGIVTPGNYDQHPDEKMEAK